MAELSVFSFLNFWMVSGDKKFSKSNFSLFTFYVTIWLNWGRASLISCSFNNEFNWVMESSFRKSIIPLTSRLSYSSIDYSSFLRFVSVSRSHSFPRNSCSRSLIINCMAVLFSLICFYSSACFSRLCVRFAFSSSIWTARASRPVFSFDFTEGYLLLWLLMVVCLVTPAFIGRIDSWRALGLASSSSPFSKSVAPSIVLLNFDLL